VMKRREFMTLLGVAAAAWPLAVQAQEADRRRRIGFLTQFAENDPSVQRYLAAFQKRLNEAGWQNGRNIEINTRWGAADVETMQRSAKELVAFQPDLILTISTPPTAAMLQQTRTIPIIFVTVTDPVGSGFVASLNRPGGNVTGFMNMEPTMAGKWLELLKEIAPRITRVTFLFNPAMSPYSEHYLKYFKAAGASLSVETITAPVQKMSEVESIFADEGREPNGGLLVMADGFLFVHRAEIISLAARYRLPAVHPWIPAESGALLCYGNDRLDQYPRAAIYADRILRGEKPGNLPVQAPVKFELVINRKTATLLGLTIPTSLLVAADEIIE
jgi:putative tryptophan/tyrosine transport system substrate-binding protein